MLKQKTAESEPSWAEQQECFETAEVLLAGLVLKPTPAFHTQWVLPGCHLQNTHSAHSHILGDTAEVVAGTGKGNTKPQDVCGPEPL